MTKVPDPSPTAIPGAASHAPGPPTSPSGYPSATPYPVPGSAAGAASTTIPMIEERVSVSKQVVETARVKISKAVEEHAEVVDTLLTHDEVEIQRVPINVYVTTPPPTRQEGDTTVFPVLREVVVTYTALLVVEEVRVTKRQVQHVDHQQVPVRSESIAVERVAGDPHSVVSAGTPSGTGK